MGMSEEKKRVISELISASKFKINEMALSMAAMSLALNILAVQVETLTKLLEETFSDTERNNLESEDDSEQDGYGRPSLN